MNPFSWAAWALVLFFQNISFTYVSRARSSGSISRHAKASVFSNGIWIFSQMIMLGPMFDYLTGKHGHAMQLASASVYTVSCLSGSLFAHYWALRTEKGKSAVGYNKKYAQITVEEWAHVKDLMQALADTMAPKNEPSVPQTLDSGTFRVERGGERVFVSNFTTRESAVSAIEQAFPDMNAQQGIVIIPN